MKIIYPFIFAVLAVIIFTACASVKQVESDANRFSKLPYDLFEKHYDTTGEIIISKQDGNTYYLKNWSLSSKHSHIKGDGVCLNTNKDTIQTGYLTVDILPHDNIIALKKQNYCIFCCGIVFFEVLVVGIYYGIKEGIFCNDDEDYIF